ncbi:MULTISPECIES: hypothetical protein [Lysobacter]|uniref:Uncharacterized protein n=1 Tax=Lysobacter firmicutimachus TaxID=1792846 RepID=A0ABU8D271_9GAMM|nr:hypothetical protein [Lysobacter antibioticus]
MMGVDDHEEAPTSPFLTKARHALDQLFEEARRKDELNFALSLSPEFKAYTLTSAIDAQRAFREYLGFLQAGQHKGQGIHCRVALALYCHTAEAAGLWGVPMCMLLVRRGEYYNLEPFAELVKRHRKTGQTIAPNANKVMGFLAEEAYDQGLPELAEVFRDAFDADVRNGFAHADYALSPEGIHVRRRHDCERIVSWPEFEALMQDGVGFFHLLGEVIGEYERAYQTPKVVVGTTAPDMPHGPWLIYMDPNSRTLTVMGGPGCTEEILWNDFHRRWPNTNGAEAQ